MQALQNERQKAGPASSADATGPESKLGDEDASDVTLRRVREKLAWMDGVIAAEVQRSEDKAAQGLEQAASELQDSDAGLASA